MKKYAIYIILLISILVSVFYGFQKKGFHEDEYYTYFSSNRSLGLYQPDREWQDRQTVYDEFSVKKGEGFNYGLVKLVQSWDVHPPVYYYIFHTVCSLTPGNFTKWSGIITNLIAFVISFIAMVMLMRELDVPIWVQVLSLTFWGLNTQTVSCNLLIRMYAWLCAAIVLCAIVHVRFMKAYDEYSDDKKRLFLRGILPIMVISYIGFLIQYFYIFFFVSIGAALTCWILFKKKDIKTAILYVVSCAVSLMLAVITYPASVHHLFGGYRGTGAAGSFFDIKNTGMRISFFVGLLNNFVFSGGLMIVVIMLILGIMALLVKNKKHKGMGAQMVILTVGTVGYFLLTTKCALLVGSASGRYEMPIYGLVILLLFWDLYYVIDAIGNKAYMIAMTAALLLFLAKGHFIDKNVLFLYPEDVEKMAYAAGNKDSVAVVMFNPATAHNVWRLTDELLCYDKVFYMDEENTQKLEDKDVTQADKIILYAADDDMQKEAFDNLISSCAVAGDFKQLFTEDMWTTYEVR
ncbi:hypothetical protein D6853_13555 [Butyrivibrio sp. X503]|uniref:hypothetical protein n=1 Tax=Butyrivibrio sp. X503 TaxID=2364878 RepID=UPI000EA8D3BF|nr:hypothetical protein [Butyrivibrio sp. X503]RKM54252.1 hypothetical protein D6853_13555 [Butyrivibrio sp. X503]